METPDQDQQVDEQDTAQAQEQGGVQQGEAPPPDEDAARNPEDPGLMDRKGA